MVVSSCFCFRRYYLLPSKDLLPNTIRTNTMTLGFARRKRFIVPEQPRGQEACSGLCSLLVSTKERAQALGNRRAGWLHRSLGGRVSSVHPEPWAGCVIPVGLPLQRHLPSHLSFLSFCSASEVFGAGRLPRCFR